MKQRPVFIQENVRLAPLTTYQIGGPAQFLAKINSLEELTSAIDWATEDHWPIYFLGGGSNLLISDQGVAGLVITLTEPEPIFTDKIVEVGAGHSLSKLVTACIDHGLAGLEWAAGIPGQVGGAVRGNAGAFGGWLADRVIEVVAYNIKSKQIEVISAQDCQYAYRHSIFKDRAELLIWSVKLALEIGNQAELQKIADEHRSYRRQRHPLLPSAGCVFKNPAVDEVARLAPKLLQAAQSVGAVSRGEVSAGFIISQAGLAGYSIGPAQISRQHSNFLVNNGGATAEQMRQLIEYVKTEIRHQYNLEFIPEVALWP
ncbi:MAG TPA: UDP-N-acetylmuramate dehydrogenase [bacterium]|jgi:UDP-N-acetylmuramate dehydrogenase|nr:UDP-N-acetylmuramate dehydrogenase [bacterium]HNZ51390.1 UDP-N-acetylmuramate dehydrogenase [bacterium]HOF79322.1 UDP-N-acetylmuramate dehydrogenase [bacterium]HOH85446.1 UDP-N-acetylmuramate dehydrogenase [bacterium]HOQ91751.1 UDP-N-acetylmuramate dehydrogenase [bacterium]